MSHAVSSHTRNTYIPPLPSPLSPLPSLLGLRFLFSSRPGRRVTCTALPSGSTSLSSELSEFEAVGSEVTEINLSSCIGPQCGCLRLRSSPSLTGTRYGNLRFSLREKEGLACCRSLQVRLLFQQPLYVQEGQEVTGMVEMVANDR